MIMGGGDGQEGDTPAAGPRPVHLKKNLGLRIDAYCEADGYQSSCRGYQSTYLLIGPASVSTLQVALLRAPKNHAMLRDRAIDEV